MSENTHILVVDDDPAVLKSAERVLREDGYCVDGVRSGKEAMRGIERNHYDLVFADLRMEETDGISLVKWMRRHYPDIGIVVITGYLLPETIKEAYKLGIHDHMIKPFTPEMLKDVAKKTLGRMREQTGTKEGEEGFPAAMLAELDAVIRQFKGRPSSTILTLLQAQEIFGYLPPAIQERIAKALDRFPSEIYGIVSAYPCFKTAPPAARTSCLVRGSERLLPGMIPKTGKRITEAVNEFLARGN